MECENMGKSVGVNRGFGPVKEKELTGWCTNAAAQAICLVQHTCSLSCHLFMTVM